MDVIYITINIKTKSQYKYYYIFSYIYALYLLYSSICTTYKSGYTSIAIVAIVVNCIAIVCNTIVLILAITEVEATRSSSTALLHYWIYTFVVWYPIVATTMASY